MEQRRGQLREACSSYSLAIDIIKTTNDLHTVAGAYNNLAQARLDLGDTAGAVAGLHDALAILTDLGETGEIIRTKWVLGRVLLGMGRYQRARDVLVETRSAFRGLSMAEEAGLCGLELVEAFLALGSVQRAEAVLEEVVDEFQRAGLSERVSTALAYLRGLVPTPRGRAAAHHVKTYIAELRDEPLRQFAPLPES